MINGSIAQIVYLARPGDQTGNTDYGELGSEPES